MLECAKGTGIERANICYILFGLREEGLIECVGTRRDFYTGEKAMVFKLKDKCAYFCNCSISFEIIDKKAAHLYFKVDENQLYTGSAFVPEYNLVPEEDDFGKDDFVFRYRKVDEELNAWEDVDEVKDLGTYEMTIAPAADSDYFFDN